uniref:Uncharacterized protein n=1 Tax=Escherichia coli TaxID=562 RepID=A0A7U1E271_ECOLX|nr:hypothetical protein [Escherichia coli]
MAIFFVLILQPSSSSISGAELLTVVFVTGAGFQMGRSERSSVCSLYPWQRLLHNMVDTLLKYPTVLKARHRSC